MTTTPPMNAPRELAPYLHWLEDQVVEHERSEQVRRNNTTADNKQAEATLDLLAKVDDKIINVGNEVSRTTLVPSVPAGLAASSVSNWDALGFPYATTTLTWSPVNTATSGGPIAVTSYELWGGNVQIINVPIDPMNPALGTHDVDSIMDPSVITSVAEPWVEITDQPLNQRQGYYVRARSEFGVLGEFSDPVFITTASAPAPLTAPTAPTLSSSKGVLVIAWDGQLLSGVPPLQFRYTYALIGTSAAGPFTRTGTTISRDGRNILVPGTVGQEYWVKLVAVDGAGNASPESAATSHVLTGVDLGDLDQSISDAIEAAQAAALAAQSDATDAAAAAAAAEDSAEAAILAANGKNRIIFSASPATGTTGFVAGDVWFQTAAGVIIGQWEFTTSWQARTIDNAVIANLNAGKINAGTLSADRIGARTISTQKLLVGNFENLLEDDSFESNSVVAWNNATANVTKVTTTPRTGTYSLRLRASTAAYEATRHQAAIRVEAGETYVFGAWMRADGASATIAQGVELSVAHGNTEANTESFTAVADNAVALTTSYVFISGIWTVPSGAKYARPRLVVKDTGNVNAYLIDDVTFYKQIPGALIVDGAITAGKIGAGEVVAGKLAVGAVAAGNIQADAVDVVHLKAGSVTASAIAVDAVQANAIAAGAVQTSHLSPDVGGQLDISANSAVTIIAGNLDAVTDELNETSGNLEEMQTYYSFGPTGAVISTPSSPFAVALRSDRIEMLENGNVVSYWNSGQMYVSSLVGVEVILGNHKLEKYGTGTVVRAL